MGLRGRAAPSSSSARPATFTVNVPDTSLVAAVDYCGISSGRSTDKFADAGLTLVPSALVTTPIIAECPYNLECRVTAGGRGRRVRGGPRRDRRDAMPRSASCGPTPTSSRWMSSTRSSTSPAPASTARWAARSPTPTASAGPSGPLPTKPEPMTALPEGVIIRIASRDEAEAVAATVRRAFRHRGRDLRSRRPAAARDAPRTSSIPSTLAT